MTLPAIHARPAARSSARASRLVKRRRLIRLVGLYAASLVFVAWAVAPILWVFISSVSTRLELYSVPYKHWIPQSPTLQNYVTILTTGIEYRGGSVLPTATLLAAGFRNSLLLALVGGAVVTLLATLAGYAFARMRFRGQGVLLVAIYSLMPLPVWVMLTTMYLIMSNLGLLDTTLGLLIIFVALAVPLHVWLMTTFMRELPASIEDAASMDGASRWQIIWLIVVPLVRPGMASVFLIAALGIWNAFLVPLVFTSSQESQTVTVMLSLFVGQYEVAWEAMAAAVVLVILPPLALAFLLQRYLIRGMTVGATSGE